MKRSSIFITLFLLVVSLCSIQSSEAAPQVEVIDGTTFDFGEVEGNQTITHEFVLKNSGDSVLRIENTKGG